METNLLFILFVVFLAFLFDFTNGFHDAANSIATIIATEVLSPLQAVLWAALFNFLAFFFFKLAIAHTISTGLVHPSIISPYVIFAGLAGAISWNIITWYFGLPSSSSHALIGGLAGAAFVKGGIHALLLPGFLKVTSAIFLSPLIGLVVAYGLTHLVNRITKGNTDATNHRWFKYIQLISSALLSLTHGGNDAQKTMGIIAILLYSGSLLGPVFYVPFWVIVSCYFVISLGTLFGGWRIIHTMGKKITHLNTLRGSCAETSAALVIYAATELGVPVSTTHTVTGAIAGVGVYESFWGTHWDMMHKIFWAWLFTIPATALIAAAVMFLKA